jgi:hypothetical protein
MKKLIGFKLFVAVLAFSGLALAQDPPAPAPASAPAGAPAPAEAAAAAPTSYDFEDDLVTGDLVRPDGELLSVRRRGNRASLIQIREHFIPEMLKSVEDL